ncbi:hypothetical protein FACS1894180_5170 [Bacteroidia bacterium]|nr:hypothetical protein FACS1894180_5170 [Bacteroidia bacterium]
MKAIHNYIIPSYSPINGKYNCYSNGYFILFRDVLVNGIVVQSAGYGPGSYSPGSLGTFQVGTDNFGSNNNGNSVYFGGSITWNISAFNFPLNMKQYDNYAVRLRVKYFYQQPSGLSKNFSRVSSATLSMPAKIGFATLVSLDKTIVIARDGIGISSGSDFFKVFFSGNNTRIQASLPTTPYDLDTGTLYKDANGNVKIAQ